MALSDNLISYYKLDESSGNAADSVGSNTGTNVNTVTYSAGKINNAANFNGTSQRFTCGTTLATAYTAITMNAWVNTNALGNFRRILSKTDNSTFNQMIRMTNGNKFAGHISTGTESTITGGTTISTSTWYMVTLTYDGSNIRLYVNGVSDATAVAKTGSLKTSSETFGIGAEVKAGGEFWSGQIDEPAVWTRALSDAEITSLYNAGAGIQYPFVTDISVAPPALAVTATLNAPTLQLIDVMSVLAPVLNIVATLQVPTLSIFGIWTNITKNNAVISNQTKNNASVSNVSKNNAVVSNINKS